MSVEDRFLEEWKKRDPFLQDYEGFKRFCEEKSKEARVQLTVSLNHDWTYSLFMELADITFGDYLAEQGVSSEQQEEIIWLTERFVEQVRALDFRNGATYVFRDRGGKWRYWGDFDHCPKEDLMYNVGQLWKFWKAVGRHIKGAFGVSKAYDHTLYIDTLSQTYQQLAGISIINYDMTNFLRNLKHQPIYPFNPPKVELTDEWLTLENNAKRLLVYSDVDDCWLDRRNELIPVALVYRESIPDVERFVAKGKELWNPFDDIDILRSGVELLHPALRKELTFVWDNSLVLWQKEADQAYRIFYKTWSREELGSRTVAELREICRAKKLDCQGRKPELIERIRDFDEVKLPLIKIEPEQDVYDYDALWDGETIHDATKIL